MNETAPAEPVNRLAVFSLLAGLITLFSFCIGVMPFLPLTAWICYPAAIITGLIATATGLISLFQIRSTGGNGKIYGIIGTGIGGLTILGTLCAIISGIMLVPVIANFIQHISK
jgi:hypothetical protein